MVLKRDKQKVKKLLSETIRLLCKNGLHFESEFCVEAMVGITLDQNEEFFLSIKETVHSDVPVATSTPSHRGRPRGQPEHRASPKAQKEHVKPEGGRKRPAAETVTSDLMPDLSLGDMQEGQEQQYWSSVTGEAPAVAPDPPPDDTSHPRKKRHTEPISDQDDSESSNVLIKDEPSAIDSDDDTSDQPEQISQQNPNLGGMSGPFAFGSQVAAAAGQQAWDQLPSLPGMAGPSGMGNNQTSDPQQQSDSGRPSGGSFGQYQAPLPADTGDARDARTAKELSRQQRLESMMMDPYFIPRLIRRIMLTKGREVTPKQVYWNFSYSNRPSIALIHQVMKEMHNKGLGLYGKLDKKTKFQKKEPWSLGTLLVAYGVSFERYEKQYHASDLAPMPHLPPLPPLPPGLPPIPINQNPLPPDNKFNMTL